jgi:hypothetical protein
MRVLDIISMQNTHLTSQHGRRSLHVGQMLRTGYKVSSFTGSGVLMCTRGYVRTSTRWLEVCLSAWSEFPAPGGQKLGEVE